MCRSVKASESRLFNVPTDIAQLTDENFPLVVPFTHFLYLLDSLLPLAERFFAQTDASATLTEAADALREHYGWRATTEVRGSVLCAVRYVRCAVCCLCLRASVCLCLCLCGCVCAVLWGAV